MERHRAVCRAVRRWSMTRRGYGWFVRGDDPVLDGIYLGADRGEARRSVEELNEGRRLKGLPGVEWGDLR